LLHGILIKLLLNNLKGFYTVYRDVFARIVEEDRPSFDKDEVYVPDFGRSDSDYESIVGTFYAFWSAYCTPRSFVWVEKHDTREASDRYVRRLMDKENKKLRDKAKKERNEEIRVIFYLITFSNLIYLSNRKILKIEFIICYRILNKYRYTTYKQDSNEYSLTFLNVSERL